MIRLTNTFILLLIATSLCPGQDADLQGPTQHVATGEIPVYLIRISEYRILKSLPQPLDVKEFIKMLKDRSAGEKLSRIQTTSVTVIDGGDTMAEFQRQVALVIGTQTLGNGVSQKISEKFELGTELSVLASSEGDQVRVNLAYESSRVEGEIPEDRMPRIKEIDIRAVHLVRPGDPVVVGIIEEGGESTVVTLLIED